MEIKPITSVCLNITDDCNFKCKYCFVEQSPHYMTLQVALDTIDFINNNLALEQTGNIHFFGGEPMLLYDEIIVPCVNYIKEKKYNILLGITTNCSLLNDEKIQFFNSNNIHVLCSIDGNQYSQNINRPSKSGKNYFDMIVQNIKKLVSYDNNITFRGTITKETASHLFENIIFAKSLGFNNTFFMPNFFETWSNNNFLKLDKELDKYALYLIECFENNSLDSLIEFNPIFNAMDNILYLSTVLDNDSKNNFIHHCGLGDNGNASINYLGEIYSCQEMPSRQNNEKSVFYIGNIYDGITETQSINLINETTQNLLNNNCGQCTLKPLCWESICSANNLMITGNINQIPEDECKWKKLIFQKAFIIMEYLKENSIFQNYINERGSN